MAKKYKPGTMVLVKWRDAVALQDSAWTTPTKAKAFKPLVVQSVGFLVKHTRKRLTIMQSFGGSSVGGVFTIPTDWVQSVERLSGES